MQLGWQLIAINDHGLLNDKSQDWAKRVCELHDLGEEYRLLFAAEREKRPRQHEHPTLRGWLMVDEPILPHGRQHGHEVEGLVTICQAHELFQEHSTDMLQELISKMVRREMTPGEVLFRLGDAGTDMFVLQSGELGCATEEDVEVKVLQPGECFGVPASHSQLSQWLVRHGIARQLLRHGTAGPITLAF